MFFGTTPSIVSQYIHREIQEKKPKRVFVPFSGNFIVEQLAGLADQEIEVHCTDVSIYSCAIGFGFMDKDPDIRLKDEILEEYSGFKGMTKPIEIAAIVVFFSEISQHFSKVDKPYYALMLREAKKNHLEYMNEIMTKLLKFKSNLSKFTFYGQDALEVLKKTKKGDFVFYDPPVLLGDYEKMYEKLRELFHWEEPEYTQMTEEVKMENLQYLHKKGCNVYYRRNDVIDPPENFKEVYRYNYKQDAYYSIISNCTNRSWVGRVAPLKEQVKHYELIDKDQEITEDTKIEFMPVPANVGNHYRLLWIKKAKMTSAGYSYLIFADKKLIGMTTVESGIKFGSDYVVIFSDPATPTSRYKTFSKLILYLINNKEFLNIVNDLTMWEHSGFTTRVFTNAPVSMKYRGTMNLSERKEANDGSWKYCLIYHSKPKLYPTVKEGLKAWIKKESHKTK